MSFWIEEDDRRPGMPVDVRQIKGALVTVIAVGITPVLPADSRLIICTGADGTLSAAIATGRTGRDGS
jgi:hypothetical protein